MSAGKVSLILFVVLSCIVMICTSYPAAAYSNRKSETANAIHDYMGNLRDYENGKNHYHPKSCRRHPGADYEQRRQDYHNALNHRQSPFYFYKHGNAHFYPPIAVLG